MMRQITTPEVPEPPGAIYSNCLVVGQTIYLSAQHAGAPGGGILGDGTVVDQARQALRKIKALVEAAGGRMSDVVKLTVFLTDMAHRTELNKARSEFFTGSGPCSTLVAVPTLIAPGLALAIDAEVVIGAGG
ncbi:MAG TPA: RidA family protein [Stellaceae bacterium]|nr:RidA family protein [Stellaceae bacterium]